MVFRSHLTDVRGKECMDIFLEHFNIGGRGRYVKINLETYFGKGAGLKYVDVTTSGTCESEFKFNLHKLLTMEEKVGGARLEYQVPNCAWSSFFLTQ